MNERGSGELVQASTILNEIEERLTREAINVHLGSQRDILQLVRVRIHKVRQHRHRQLQIATRMSTRKHIKS